LPFLCYFIQINYLVTTKEDPYCILLIRYCSLQHRTEYTCFQLLQHVLQKKEKNYLVFPSLLLSIILLLYTKNTPFFWQYIGYGHGGTWWRKWERLNAGESNGKLILRTCPGCSALEPYHSPD